MPDDDIWISPEFPLAALSFSFASTHSGNFSPAAEIAPIAVRDVFSSVSVKDLTVFAPFSASPFLGASKSRQQVSSMLKTRSDG
jgi:hypothetical protein